MAFIWFCFISHFLFVLVWLSKFYTVHDEWFPSREEENFPARFQQIVVLANVPTSAPLSGAWLLSSPWERPAVHLHSPRVFVLLSVHTRSAPLTSCGGSAAVTDREPKLKTPVGIKGHCFIRIIHSNTINSPCSGGRGRVYAREKDGSKGFFIYSLSLIRIFFLQQLY